MVGRALRQAVRGEWQGRRPLSGVPLAPKDNQESRWWREEVGATSVDNGRTRRAEIPTHKGRYWWGGNEVRWSVDRVSH